MKANKTASKCLDSTGNKMVHVSDKIPPFIELKMVKNLAAFEKVLLLHRSSYKADVF